MEKLKSGFVTLLGLPNAGKSSLLNKFVGDEIAIVTPKPQTTWTTMRAFVSREDLQLVLTDTPGLQEGTKALNAALTKNATRAIDMAKEGNEIVALVMDAAELGKRIRDKKPLGIDALKNILEHEFGVLPLKLPLIPVLNKADLLRKPEYRQQIEEAIRPLIEQTFANAQLPIWTSVKTGEGIEEWFEKLKTMLPLGTKGELFEEDALSDKTVRELSAEFVREQCFLQLGEELPYSIAVQIDSFDEKDPKIIRIEATLHLERESQKPIVLGRGGTKIKAIGTKAREKIERMVGSKVFLGLKVKVAPHWARETKLVDRFGYGDRK